MNDIDALLGPPSTPPVSNTVSGQPDLSGSKGGSAAIPSILHDAKVADFARVYVLGDGGKGRVIEQFSGQTGYHIRTIPRSRFPFATALGAGAGYLAVVERYGAEDLIRITDKYAGAGAGGFDSDGFPKDSVNWGAVPDMKQIHTGGRVTGIQIMPRGVLIAALDMGDGLPTFLCADIDGNYDLYNKTFSLPAPYDVLGIATGRISTIDQAQGEWAHEFLASVAGNDGPCAVQVDFIQEKVTGLIGLPNETVFGLANAGGVFSAGMGTNVALTNIYRLERADNSTFMSGLFSDKLVPDPTNTAVQQTFTPLDMSGLSSAQYYQAAQQLNNRFGPTLSSQEETGPDAAVTEGGRAVSGTTTTLNDGRTQAATKYNTNVYGTAYEVPAKVIENPSGDSYPVVVDLDSVSNTVGELLVSTVAGAMDTMKPLYRLLHGTHYDWLSDGGYTYGCATPGQDTVTPVTSGLRPISIAVDKSSEPGKLKELPDLKVALVDIYSGRLLYTSPKSLGYKWYGGGSAGLKLTVEAAQTTKKTQCSTNQDTAIDQDYDGIDYQYDDRGQVTRLTRDEAHQVQFATANDGRSPWGLYMPRVVNGGTISLQPYDSRTVLTRDDSGAYLDWWLPAGARIAPAVPLGVENKLFYPARGPNTPTPIFQYSATSGFFGLNWQKDEVFGPGDSVTYQTPDSILNYKLNGLDTTAAVEPAAPETAAAVATNSLSAFSIISGLGDHPSLRRGVVFDTDIRSWIGVEVMLNRSGVVDGVDAWTQPSAYENGLGVQVGASAYDGHLEAIHCGDGNHVQGIMPGYAYDYGDESFNSAMGQWQVEVLANGVPIRSIGKQVTFDEQIAYLAPSEAQDELMQTLHASGAVDPLLGYHKGKVYYTRELITSVTIRAKLVNYAFGVYRTGFHTLSYPHDDYIGDGPTLCSGADPGFYAANNCEAICCGNVSCISQVQFGNKLYSSDTVRPKVINILWEGQVTYQIPNTNPYASKSLAVGHLINAFMKFDLNTAMSAYNVNLRQGDSSS